VILVGGLGTRLRPITSRTPKPVVPLLGRPFVSCILGMVAAQGVERVVLSSGHLADVIEDVIGDGAAWGLDVAYVREPHPLGTAGAIANCADKLTDEPFFAFNGDVLSEPDLSALAGIHAAHDAAATVCLTEVADPSRFGVARLNDDSSISEFVEKPSAWEGAALANAGVYVLDPEVLELIPRGVEFSIERRVFPRLAARGTLHGRVDTGYWRDIGTPESYLQAHLDLLDGVVTLPGLVGAAGEPGVMSPLAVRAPKAIIAPGARLVPPYHIGPGAIVGAGAEVGPYCVLGAGSAVGVGARICRSVLHKACVIGSEAEVEGSVLADGSRVGRAATVVDAVLGERSRVAEGVRLAPGTRLDPEATACDDIAGPPPRLVSR
jgi:mannose-1-phosphate guanylyltransferase